MRRVVLRWSAVVWCSCVATEMSHTADHRGALAVVPSQTIQHLRAELFSDSKLKKKQKHKAQQQQRQQQQRRRRRQRRQDESLTDAEEDKRPGAAPKAEPGRRLSAPMQEDAVLELVIPSNKSEAVDAVVLAQMDQRKRDYIAAQIVELTKKRPDWQGSPSSPTKLTFSRTSNYHVIAQQDLLNYDGFRKQVWRGDTRDAIAIRLQLPGQSGCALGGCAGE